MFSEQKIEASVSGHKARNQPLLELIQSRGVSLDRPLNIEHHFWAGNQHQAAKLGKALYEAGLLILILAPCEDGRWNVEAGTRASASETANPDLVEKLVRLAAEFDSDYDGWGTHLSD